MTERKENQQFFPSVKQALARVHPFANMFVVQIPDTRSNKDTTKLWYKDCTGTEYIVNPLVTVWHRDIAASECIGYVGECK